MCAFATVVGFDRDRVFYPTLVMVIATYYILFAVIGSSMPALAKESLIAGVFLALSVAGFKKNDWFGPEHDTADGAFRGRGRSPARYSMIVKTVGA